ncbi:hypothetical protein D9619_007794 [Psilocybe cf. subviscida]|uniref:Hydrophobin n=1 Tax=Psilocybe cf. subviscida TaxID=2480587 RepID=A0A8H5AUF4_9AGAR|nr:hypothetical protein D9619_007794 [Psilocybe cf. subviscida]
MQFKLAALTTLAVATLAAATPTKRADQCNVGTLQCCNSLQAANSPAASNLLGPLGVVVGAVQGLVGITCSPLSAIAISGNSCGGLCRSKTPPHSRTDLIGLGKGGGWLSTSFWIDPAADIAGVNGVQTICVTLGPGDEDVDKAYDTFELLIYSSLQLRLPSKSYTISVHDISRT